MSDITINFKDNDDASAFFAWWTNEGRELLENAVPGIQVSWPSFNPDHRITHGPTTQTIDYAP